MTKYMKLLLLLVVFFTLNLPSLLLARQNTLTGGLGTTFDLRERSYETFVDDPNTDENEADTTSRREDDYKWLVIRPLVVVTSEGVRDNFKLSIAPQIRFDLMESDSRWNSDFFISGDRYMTRNWQLEASNSFWIRDYYRSDDPVAAVSSDGDTSGTPNSVLDTTRSDPQLSPDVGNTRHWRNLFRLGSNHTYKEDSLFRIAFDYTVLRRDEDDDVSVNNSLRDYDRYALRFLNDHRFSKIWSSLIDVSFVRGDFEETDPEVAQEVADSIAPDSEIVISEDDLSNDLQEYYLRLAVNNASINHNILSLAYDYIGSRYDDVLRDDGDIHQARLTWRRDHSPQLYTKLGGGPSYAKVENRDGNWDWNGIGELNYLIEHGNLGMLVEKGYTVNNFSGTSDRGIVDFWDARFFCNYELIQNLALRAELGYLYEDRSDPIVAVRRIAAAGATIDDVEDEDVATLEEYHRDRYRAGLGASYTFWRDYTASADYIFFRQESDRLNQNYDDHRILLTISWQNDLLRW